MGENIVFRNQKINGLETIFPNILYPKALKYYTGAH